MRVLRLEIEGFGPFRDRQVVDLSAAAATGLLLVTGPTGAGKSTLFDAISFALYGAVPRYDGQVGRIRSDHLPPARGTRVVLDFEMGVERYRVARTPDWQRPKKRGEGTTLEKATAQLWRWDPVLGDWAGVASRPADVGTEMVRVLRLTHDQFLQVVLLAQGGFQRFLRAGDEERQMTLRSLFRTQRFADIERLLVAERQRLAQGAQQREARVRGALEQLEESIVPDRVPGSDEAFAERVERLSSELRTERERVVAAVDAAAESARLHAEHAARVRDLQVVAAAQSRRARARAELDVLESERAAQAADRERLEQAERAERVRGVRAACEEAAAVEARAMSAWSASAERFREAAGTPGADLKRLLEDTGAPEPMIDAAVRACETELQRLDALVAVLETPEREERDRPERSIAHDRLSDALAVAQRERAEVAERAAELPALLTRAREEIEGARLLAARLPELRSACSDARERHDAVQRLAALTPSLTEARARTARAAEELSTAGSALRDLHARRIAAMSAELAQELVAGAPCAVCGSPTHPDPAAPTDIVSEAELAAAEAEHRTAQEVYDAERRREAELAQQVIGARTAARVEEMETLADLPPGLAEQAALAVERAAGRVREAERAAAGIPGNEQQLTALESEESQLQIDASDATTRVTQAEGELRASAETLEQLDARITAARDSFDTVRERREALTEQREHVRVAQEAARSLLSAREHHEQRTADLQRAIADAGFGDAEAAAAAMLSGETRADLAERLRAADAAEQRLRGVLADPDVQAAPEDAVPLADAELRLAELAEAAGEHARTAGALEGRLADWTERWKRLSGDVRSAGDEAARLLRLRRFADAVQGKEPNTKRMRLEVFVLAAQLEAIIAAANLRLARMVGGRYLLQHDDALRSRGRQSGLGLAIADAYTGRIRSTDSLSGGETFLVALALALGLADVVTAQAGGMRLDTLFIDEGFGTLDPDALDQAIAVLDGLREGGRTVALISHVAELKERLPAQLEVVVTDGGVSTLRGTGSSGAEPMTGATEDA